MQQLYFFNNAVLIESLTPTKRDGDKGVAWGGYCTRMMLHCLYTISMLCLLRYDEALNIRWEDITFGYDANGIQFIQLNLLFRKTHQNGSESLCDATTTSSDIVSYRHRTIFSISRPHEAVDVRSHGDR